MSTNTRIRPVMRAEGAFPGRSVVQFDKVPPDFGVGSLFTDGARVWTVVSFTTIKCVSGSEVPFVVTDEPFPTEPLDVVMID